MDEKKNRIKNKLKQWGRWNKLDISQYIYRLYSVDSIEFHLSDFILA